jgi:hypothetical protein
MSEPMSPPKWYTVAQVAQLLGYGESKVRMTAGSITGALLGGLLLGVIPNLVLIRTLALLLLTSAVKLWRH